MELYIEPIRPTRNPITGHFLKGIAPHNKGKKWEDYLDKETADRIRKNMVHIGRPDFGGNNRKQVIAIYKGKFFGVFESSREAGSRLGLIDRNIRACCDGKRSRCGNIHFFWEKDFDRWSVLLK